jgi:molecular chaperone GrpE (heat shock protein)
MNKKETNQPKPAEEKVEKKQIETEVSLEVEINRLKEEKLRLLADSENQRKNYQQTIEYIRNYSNKKIIL